MLHEISDERYCFIEDTICDAFLLVLKEKGIEKITVTDIIKEPELFAVHSITTTKIFQLL